MKKITILLFVFCTTIVLAQDVERITINGNIVVTSNDKEDVTVYNTSSNKGTTTDKDGSFTIEVALHDVIEFGALQFQDFKVNITQEVIDSKLLTVMLIESINRLDEVVVLSKGLTGNLTADTKDIKTYNADMDAIYFGLDNIEQFEFHQDYKTKVTNPAFDSYNPRVENMINIIAVAEIIAKAIFKKKDSKTKPKTQEITITLEEVLERYSSAYLTSNFKIPTDKISEFQDYVKEQDITKELFILENELQFLEKLNQMSITFLNSKRDKK